MTREHDFETSLARSHASEDLPFWEAIYRDAFPLFLSMTSYPQDGEHQRAGIDRSVQLSNGKQLLIDEKVRAKGYSDILLEFIADKERRLPGWVCKPLRADYIAYLVPEPVGICHLLPVPQLQLAWLRKGEEWQQKYGVIHVPNRTGSRSWTTVCCCVEPGALFKAISHCLHIEFTSEAAPARASGARP